MWSGVPQSRQERIHATGIFIDKKISEIVDPRSSFERAQRGYPGHGIKRSAFNQILRFPGKLGARGQFPPDALGNEVSQAITSRYPFNHDSPGVLYFKCSSQACCGKGNRESSISQQPPSYGRLSPMRANRFGSLARMSGTREVKKRFSLCT
jgi:hypothetical protein